MSVSTNKIKRRLAAIVLGAAIGAFVTPTAHAGDRIVDDWFRDVPRVAATQPPPPQGLEGYMIRYYILSLDRSPSGTSDHVVDDWFRDSTSVSPASSSGDGLGAREIGGVAVSAAVLLLLGGLVLGRRQVRHTRHSIEGV
jgi:hypothetical protein